MILLLSLLSPIAELFPNLYLSWWLPDNEKIMEYLKYKNLRVLAVLLVWLPILYTLSKITPFYLTLILAILILTAFGLRLYYFDNALQYYIKNGEEYSEPSKLPEVIYFFVFSCIGFILFTRIEEFKWLVPAAIFLIYFGAFNMATYRWGVKKDIRFDIAGRIIFTIGFILNLYNLIRASIDL